MSSTKEDGQADQPVAAGGGVEGGASLGVLARQPIIFVTNGNAIYRCGERIFLRCE